MWQITSSVFLGWSLGSNDASNVFGTAVASRMVNFWTAAILCSVFVMLGALVDGHEGFHTYNTLASTSANTGFIVTLAAAITVTMMSIFGLPVSTSQAVVGALVLIGVMKNNLDPSSLLKIVTCWIATPIGAALVTIILYFSLGKLMNWLAPNVFSYDWFLRAALISAGSYGAYALGANNVANVTGPFVGADGLTTFWAAAIGGASIALGVLTYSKNVMMTVGKNLVKLDAFTAFVAILSEAITVHIFAIIGVPVSTSQAIVGAVLGIGILKGVQTINKKTLWLILFGWIGTPAISAGCAFALFSAFSWFGWL